MHSSYVLLIEIVSLFLTGSPQSTSRFRREFLEKINDYRGLHGCGALVLYSSLSDLAQAQACDYRDSLGEGYMDDSTTQLVGLHPFPVKKIDYWYAEQFYYNYDAPEYNNGSVHFTLMIWKSSEYLGVGACLYKQGFFYVVLKLQPAGNVKGQFQENVPRPLSAAKSHLKTNGNFPAIAFILLYKMLECSADIHV